MMHMRFLKFFYFLSIQQKKHWNKVHIVQSDSNNIILLRFHLILLSMSCKSVGPSSCPTIKLFEYRAIWLPVLINTHICTFNRDLKEILLKFLLLSLHNYPVEYFLSISIFNFTMKKMVLKSTKNLLTLHM